MEKTHLTFEELENKIGAMIREKYMESIEKELNPDYKKTLSNWMDTEIKHLLVSTESISKIEIRTQSIVFMFGKKFEKAKSLIRLMEEHDLRENSGLFSQILGLL